ncbi:hypothetical protein EJ08DRAFT_701367 [Tothia fuscella]|uniref:Uncharacterized protein n=1 Tax=Tothia fuscella TaxID=1048955 RepID=A0A9P4TUY3_9PEZI|nr:hypothetical protein EJ08DRAFT_701367 [Tothia fuscella]
MEQRRFQWPPLPVSKINTNKYAGSILSHSAALKADIGLLLASSYQSRSGRIELDGVQFDQFCFGIAILDSKIQQTHNDIPFQLPPANAVVTEQTLNVPPPFPIQTSQQERPTIALPDEHKRTCAKRAFDGASALSAIRVYQPAHKKFKQIPKIRQTKELAKESKDPQTKEIQETAEENERPQSRESQETAKENENPQHIQVEPPSSSPAPAEPAQKQGPVSSARNGRPASWTCRGPEHYSPLNEWVSI